MSTVAASNQGKSIPSNLPDVGQSGQPSQQSGIQAPVNKPGNIQAPINQQGDIQAPINQHGDIQGQTGQSGSGAAANSKPVTSQADAQCDGKSSLGKKSTNSLLVSTRQRGNPILKHIRNVPWEYEDIIPDYQMGQTTCALFLSLRYHQLNPNYIHERLKQLGHSYNLRVLLTLIDIKDPHHCLKNLAKMSILADCTLMLAFSQDEAGRYLETYKAYENKPPDLIMEKTEGNHMTRVTDCLTKVRRVNKTDAMTLMSAFGSFDNIVKSSEEDLSLCPGFGPQKAQRLHSAFHEPFLKSKKKPSIAHKSGNSTEGSSQKKDQTNAT